MNAKGFWATSLLLISLFLYLFILNPVSIIGFSPPKSEAELKRNRIQNLPLKYKRIQIKKSFYNEITKSENMLYEIRDKNGIKYSLINKKIQDILRKQNETKEANCWYNYDKEKVILVKEKDRLLKEMRDIEEVIKESWFIKGKNIYRRYLEITDYHLSKIETDIDYCEKWNIDISCLNNS